MSAENPSIIHFYDIDLRNVGGEIYYFHPGLNEFGESVKWTRLEKIGDKDVPVLQEYQAFPIQIEGIEYDGGGRLPRPTLTVSNVMGMLGQLVRAHRDLNGCLLTHRMTLSMFLDAENFKDGNLVWEEQRKIGEYYEFPKETFIFERKAEETSEYIKFELASALDLEGQMLPKRNYNANYCSHDYRGPLCQYVGNRCFDVNDNELLGPDRAEKDKCGRRLKSCEVRFGEGEELPFGGYPGVGLIAR